MNTSLWTPTDTTAKLTQSGGSLNWAAGAAAWGDPAAVSIPSFTRRGSGANTVFEVEVTPTSGTLHMGLHSSATLSQNIANYIRIAGTAIAAGVGSGITVLPPTLAASASARFKMQLKSTGCIWYESTDGGITYQPIWEEAATSAATLYAMLNSYQSVAKNDFVRVYEAIPKTPVISVTPAAPVPALGAERLTNGNMETNGTWAAYNIPTSQEQSSAQAYAGTASWKVVGNITQGIYQNNNFSALGGEFYKLSCQAYSGIADVYIIVASNTTGDYRVPVTINTWTNAYRIGRIIDPGNRAIVFAVGNGAGATVYFDDASFKIYGVASLCSSTYDAGTKAGIFDFNHGTIGGEMSTVDGYRGGRLCVSSDGKYALHVFVDKLNNLVLFRRENDVIIADSISTSAGVTYAANRRIRVVTALKTGTTYYVGLYYESASGVFTKIGSTLEIDLASYGTLVQTFSTNSGATDMAVTVNV